MRDVLAVGEIESFGLNRDLVLLFDRLIRGLQIGGVAQHEDAIAASAASSSAMARPIPREPPVMSAVFTSRIQLHV